MPKYKAATRPAERKLHVPWEPKDRGLAALLAVVKNEAPKVEVLKEKVKAAKDELAPHNDKLKEAHKEIDLGQSQMVVCEEQCIFDKNIVRTVRIDNGAVVDTRPMKPKDRQTGAFDSEKEVDVED